MVLGKFRHFPFRPFILQSAQWLSSTAMNVVDQHMPCLVQLLKLSEDLDQMNVESRTANVASSIQDRGLRVKSRLATLKSSLAFPLSDSRKDHHHYVYHSSLC
jgi:hypothetical protein